MRETVALGTQMRGCHFGKESLTPSPFSQAAALTAFSLSCSSGHGMGASGGGGGSYSCGGDGELAVGVSCTHHPQMEPPRGSHTGQEKEKAAEMATWWDWRSKRRWGRRKGRQKRCQLSCGRGINECCAHIEHCQR